MLNKQGIDVSFAQGLDTKTDPRRVSIGKFLRLQNSVFTKGGLLQKRNGFGSLASLPDTTYTYLTTFNGNLTAIGKNIAAYNASNASWVTKSALQPVSVNTQPMIRNNFNQSAMDLAVSSSGVACATYLETNAGSTTNKYVIFDSATGQNIVAPVTVTGSAGTISGGMRVYVLGNYFVIIFTTTITAVDHLQYIAIPIANPTAPTAPTDIASSYVSSTALSWDAVNAPNGLYIMYNTTSGGQAVKITYLTPGLTLVVAKTFSGYKADYASICVDNTTPSNPTICMSFYKTTGSIGYTIAVDQNLNQVMAPTSFASGVSTANLASAAQNGVVTVYIENTNSYSFTTGNGNASNFITAVPITIATATVGSLATILRSVGLASKAFIYGSNIYALGAYQSNYQPTYFLINMSQSTSAAPVLVAKLAYQNGGGYLTKGLPNVTLIGAAGYVPYQFKDLIQAVNKNTNVSTGTQVAGIYSQTGLNFATLTFTTANADTAEIGNNLNLSGGFLWAYDGNLPVEQNFFLWPDIGPSSPPNPINSSAAAWSATGGSMAAQPDGATNTNAYYYQITYEWSDNQGNIFRSAPSIPIAVTTTGSGTAGSVVIKVPTLRITMKSANPVKIVIYRWSIAQQNYYQVTSLTSPTLNDTTADSISYTDTLADATILGNNLIYTTGGVVEDVNAPASDVLTIFDTRLWTVDAEDRNLLWYSKQVIEATPVEMSDLFTMYIPPTTATQGPTGPIKAIAPLDDKLIIFKANAVLYINGSGPDNTGANNQYSPPIFVTGTVGCSIQNSIVLIPDGLMFQSDKGIWLLDRGLNTSYIGAPVEDFTTGATVLSAVNVPGTNQVRFTLSSGITLMYDYFYQQWGTFNGIPAVSSCIYGAMHTFINSYGAAYQETPGGYVDGSNPVLMSFTTGPLRLGDLQNYQRAYFFYLLGTYITPHKLYIQLTYDYEAAPSQSILITPTNYSTPYGSGDSQSPYGQGNPYGGGSNLELWRVFLERQRCMAFQISLNEVYDASYGGAPGAGLTLSGLNVVCAFKKPFRPQPAASSAG